MKIRDVIRYGKDEEVQKHLESIRKSLIYLAQEMRDKLERTELNLVLHNLLTSTAAEISSIIDCYHMRSEIKAWCTRNIYELNLIVRYILKSDENLRKWMAEAVNDEIEIIDGFIELAEDESDSKVTIMKGRISEIKGVVENINSH